MANIVEVTVPDIGDFKDVPVIEVTVKPGDAIKREDPLYALESQKATMEVPSPVASTVREVLARIGDKISEARLLVTVSTGVEAASPARGKGVFPWAASGRVIANSRDEGYSKLLFEEATHRVIGGGIVGTHAGDLIGEVCLAVAMGCERGMRARPYTRTPALCESIGMAAEVFEGMH